MCLLSFRCSVSRSQGCAHVEYVTTELGRNYTYGLEGPMAAMRAGGKRKNRRQYLLYK